MGKITYPDKTTGDQFTGAEATEIKTVVNANDDAATLFVEAWSTSIRADKKRTHATPFTMSGDLALTTDETNAVIGFGETKKIIGDGSVLSIVGGIYPANKSSVITIAGTQYLLVFMWDGTVFQSSIDRITDEEFPSLILFEDDFAGTTIDTAKWVPIATADIGITQNDKLIFTDLTTNAAPALTKISTEGKFTFNTTGAITVFRFDLDLTNLASEDHGIVVSVRDSTNDEIYGVIRLGSVGVTDLESFVKTGGVVESPNVTLGVSPIGSFKIVFSGGTASWYKWNGSAWGAALHTFAYVDKTDYFINNYRSAESTTGDYAEIDNVYVTNDDYSTLIPL